MIKLQYLTFRLLESFHKGMLNSVIRMCIQTIVQCSLLIFTGQSFINTPR